MGAATISSPDQVACAKDALAKKTGMVGILTEGDGMFKLVGPLTATISRSSSRSSASVWTCPERKWYCRTTSSYHVFER